MKKLIQLFAIVLLILGSTQLLSAHPGHHRHPNFRIVASFGTFHQWGVPNRIINEVDFYYPYHQWVHVSRIHTGRSFFFNVVLERNGGFIELELARNGRILHASHYYDYPLINHVCSSFCGFHNGFYETYRVYRGHRHFRARAHVYYRPNVVVVNVPRSYRARNRYFAYERYSRFGNGNHRYARDSRRVVRNRANRSNQYRTNNNKGRSYARSNNRSAQKAYNRNGRSNGKSYERNARSNQNNKSYGRSRTSASNARVASNESRSNRSAVSSRSASKTRQSKSRVGSSKVSSSRSSKGSSVRSSGSGRGSSSRSAGRSSSRSSSRSSRGGSRN